MRKGIILLAVLTSILTFSVVSRVNAEGYEVTAVGGVLNPTNFVMTLTQAMMAVTAIFGFIIAIALIRLKNR